MIEIKIIWIVANTIAAAWLSYTVLFNPILQAAMSKWGGSVSDRMAFTLLGILVTFHCALSITLCLLASVGAAVVVTSLIGFGWALMSYFLLQRFAHPIERCLRVLKNPMFHPLVAFGGFISSTFAIIFLADWRLAFIPIVLWLLLGFLCAEIAIRRYMRSSKRSGSDCDRDMAIFAINNTQGRGRSFNDLFFSKKMNRYPFP
jgi:hypothetical protein